MIFRPIKCLHSHRSLHVAIHFVLCFRFVCCIHIYHSYYAQVESQLYGLPSEITVGHASCRLYYHSISPSSCLLWLAVWLCDCLPDYMTAFIPAYWYNCLPACMTAWSPVCMFVCLFPDCKFVSLPACMPPCLQLCDCLHVYLLACLYVCLITCLSKWPDKLAECVKHSSPVFGDRGFGPHGLDPWSSQTNDLKMDNCPFLARHY